MDQIKIKNLEVFCHHGVFPEENVLGQKFVVTAIMETDTRRAGMHDSLPDSIHYGEAAAQITRFMQEHTYQLIETVAEQLACELLRTVGNLRAVTLEIAKPWAPVGLPLETVSVQIYRAWHTAYIAFGSNVGDTEGNIDQAITLLAAHPDIRLGQISRRILTKPYGGVEMDDVLNGCLQLETLLTPEELLDVCQDAEQQAHRERVIHWGPRTLDLDLLLYDREIIGTERLAVPHPEMAKRDFVLQPMAEIAPYLYHPVLGKTMRQLWEELQEKTTGKIQMEP